jgi:hypothetical protein
LSITLRLRPVTTSKTSSEYSATSFAQRELAGQANSATCLCRAYWKATNSRAQRYNHLFNRQCIC